MKIKILKKNIIQYLITVIILMFCINVTYSIFVFDNYSWLPLAIDFIVIFFSLCSNLINIKRVYCEMIKQFFLPLIIPSVLSAFTSVLIYNSEKYTMSSFKYILWLYGAYLLGYFLVEKFKIKAFYLFLTAGTISYITVIFQALITNNWGILEVHELTYIYGMLFVFFLAYKDITNKVRIITCIICVLGIILGGKRILWLAVIIALFTYFIFYKIIDGKAKLLRIITISTVILTFLWIWIVKNGYFESICLKFNINDMSRLKMWNYFKKDYNFSLSYWGRGLTYTDIVMSEVHSQLFISTAIPIHNAILKMFIGWGFIPLAYYLYAYIYMRVLYIMKKEQNKNAWIFFIVTIIFLIINFFGDTMFNIGISICYAMIWTILQNSDRYGGN